MRLNIEDDKALYRRAQNESGSRLCADELMTSLTRAAFVHIVVLKVSYIWFHCNLFDACTR